MWSRYNALQLGVVRRMTNNLSAQVSYTYSSCTDLSSGDWTQEGGTIIANPYNISVDRGNCLFMIRHNLTGNFLYILPFTKNRLVSGWQLGGILYFATGSPFDVTTFSNGSSDIGSVGNDRANYVRRRAGLQQYAHQCELCELQRNQLRERELFRGGARRRTGQLSEKRLVRARQHHLQPFPAEEHETLRAP